MTALFWQTLLTAFITGGGCSIILYLLQRHDQKKDCRDEETQKMVNLLIGMGHDRIYSLGMDAIKKGHISAGEYDNLVHGLYEPYKALGGNGTGTRIIEEVKKLPIVEEE